MQSGSFYLEGGALTYPPSRLISGIARRLASDPGATSVNQIFEMNDNRFRRKRMAVPIENEISDHDVQIIVTSMMEEFQKSANPTMEGFPAVY